MTLMADSSCGAVWFAPSLSFASLVLPVKAAAALASVAAVASFRVSAGMAAVAGSSAADAGVVVAAASATVTCSSIICPFHDKTRNKIEIEKMALCQQKRVVKNQFHLFDFNHR